MYKVILSHIQVKNPKKFAQTGLNIRSDFGSQLPYSESVSQWIRLGKHVIVCCEIRRREKEQETAKVDCMGVYKRK